MTAHCAAPGLVFFTPAWQLVSTLSAQQVHELNDIRLRLAWHLLASPLSTGELRLASAARRLLLRFRDRLNEALNSERECADDAGDYWHMATLVWRSWDDGAVDSVRAFLAQHAKSLGVADAEADALGREVLAAVETELFPALHLKSFLLWKDAPPAALAWQLEQLHSAWLTPSLRPELLELYAACLQAMGARSITPNEKIAQALASCLRGIADGRLSELLARAYAQAMRPRVKELVASRPLFSEVEKMHALVAEVEQAGPPCVALLALRGSLCCEAVLANRRRRWFESRERTAHYLSCALAVSPQPGEVEYLLDTLRPLIRRGPEGIDAFLDTAEGQALVARRKEALAREARLPEPPLALPMLAAEPRTVPYKRSAWRRALNLEQGFSLREPGVERLVVSRQLRYRLSRIFYDGALVGTCSRSKLLQGQKFELADGSRLHAQLLDRVWTGGSGELHLLHNGFHVPGSEGHPQAHKKQALRGLLLTLVTIALMGLLTWRYVAWAGALSFGLILLNIPSLMLFAYLRSRLFYYLAPAFFGLTLLLSLSEDLAVEIVSGSALAGALTMLSLIPFRELDWKLISKKLKRGALLAICPVLAATLYLSGYIGEVLFFLLVAVTVGIFLFAATRSSWDDSPQDEAPADEDAEVAEQLAGHHEQRIALEPNQGQLVVSWGARWHYFRVSCDDRLISETFAPEARKQAKKGIVFPLRDGSEVLVQWARDFLTGGLRVLRNGAPVPEGGSPPDSTNRSAAAMLCMLATLKLTLALVIGLGKVSNPSAGSVWLELGIGALFLLLSYWVERRSRLGFLVAVLAVLGYGVLHTASFLQNQGSPVIFAIVSGFLGGLLFTLVQGQRALSALQRCKIRVPAPAELPREPLFSLPMAPNPTAESSLAQRLAWHLIHPSEKGLSRLGLAAALLMPKLRWQRAWALIQEAERHERAGHEVDASEAWDLAAYEWAWSLRARPLHQSLIAEARRLGAVSPEAAADVILWAAATQLLPLIRERAIAARQPAPSKKKASGWWRWAWLFSTRDALVKAAAFGGLLFLLHAALVRTPGLLRALSQERNYAQVTATAESGEDVELIAKGLKFLAQASEQDPRVTEVRTLLNEAVVRRVMQLTDAGQEAAARSLLDTYQRSTAQLDAQAAGEAGGAP